MGGIGGAITSASSKGDSVESNLNVFSLSGDHEASTSLGLQVVASNEDALREAIASMAANILFCGNPPA